MVRRVSCDTIIIIPKREACNRQQQHILVTHILHSLLVLLLHSLMVLNNSAVATQKKAMAYITTVKSLRSNPYMDRSSNWKLT